jgi:hypothetical protein
MDQSLDEKIKEYRQEESNIIRELDDIEQELHQQSIQGDPRSFEYIYSRMAKDRYEQKLKEAASHIVNFAESEGPKALAQVPMDILAIASYEKKATKPEVTKESDQGIVPKKQEKDLTKTLAMESAPMVDWR